MSSELPPSAPSCPPDRRSPVATACSRAPRAHPQDQRLPALDAAEPVLGDAGRPGGQQAAADLQGATRMPAEPEAPERQDVTGDGQQHHGQQDRHHRQPDVQPDRMTAQVTERLPDRPELGRVQPCLTHQPEPESDQNRAGDHPGKGGRGERDPPGSQPGEFDLGRGLRIRVLDRGRGRIVGIGVEFIRGGWPVRAMQQFGPQHRDGGGGQAVQSRRWRGRVRTAGADVHPDQAQHPLQRMRADVHRADPVSRHGQVLALHDPPADLHHGRGDPVPGRQVARDPEDDDHAGADEAPGGSALVAPSGDDEYQQHRDEPDDLPDRLHQQHPGGQAAPRDLRARRGGRS